MEPSKKSNIFKVYVFLIISLLFESCSVFYYNSSKKDLNALEDYFFHKKDSLASLVRINGIVYFDSLYIYYNSNVRPNHLDTKLFFSTKSKTYFVSEIKPNQEFKVKNRLFEYEIFKNTSYVIVPSIGFLTTSVMSNVKDPQLLEKIQRIVNNNTDLPTGHKVSHQYILPKNRLCNSFGCENTMFLSVNMPVAYFNHYYNKCICPPMFYFLGENKFYDDMLNIFIPLPLDTNSLNNP